MRTRYSQTLTAVGLLMVVQLTTVAVPVWCGRFDCEAFQTVVIPLIEAPGEVTADHMGAWTKAAMVTGFFEMTKDRLAEQPTWVSAFYDAESLWVLFRCEGHPGGDLQAEVKEHDGPVWRDDAVEVFLGPGHSHRTYYHLAVNSIGVTYDASGTDSRWESKAQVRTETDAKGWTAALRVPFASFGAATPRDGEVWTVNFCRNRTSAARSSWAPVQVTFVEPERFGHLVFGGRSEEAARVRKIEPIVIGPNRMFFEEGSVSERRLEGKDAKGRSVFTAEERPALDGSVSFRIPTDRVRRLEVSLAGKTGSELMAFRLPVETPALSHRVPALRNKFDAVRRTIAVVRAGKLQLPAEALEKMQAALDRVDSDLQEAEETVRNPARHRPENWERLAETVPKMELALDGPWGYAQTVRHLPGETAPDFALGLANSMRKIMIRDFPFEGSYADRYEVSLAKNEHEGFQMVVMPFHRDLAKATVAVSELRHRKTGMPFAGKIEVSLVGHVKVGDNQPYEVDYIGWYPDPLLSFQPSCDVKAGEHVAFWLDVASDKAAAPGDYEGTVTVSAEGCRTLRVRLQVHVWGFELADGTHLRNAFTYDPYAPGKFHGDGWNEQLKRRYRDLILEHRLNIDHLYRKEPPEIELLQYGVKRGMNAFNIKYIGKGAAPEEIIRILDGCVPQLKAAGLFDLAYIYGFDEVHDEYFAHLGKVYSAIHERHPGLETMTTAYDPSFGRKSGLREAVDIWVPLTPSYDAAEAEQLRAEGKEMWWYTCIVPRHPYANWFIEYPAIEARLLTGAMSYKSRTGGFLYYLINNWRDNRKPITSGPYTDWDPGSCEDRRQKLANGDGSLICPGPDRPLSTIRFENVRDGFEDYEYLYLLAEMVKQVASRTSNPQRARFLSQARELLAVPPEVVKTVTDYTRDPDEVYGFRERVAKAIEEGARLAQ